MSPPVSDKLLHRCSARSFFYVPGFFCTSSNSKIKPLSKDFNDSGPRGRGCDLLFVFCDFLLASEETGCGLKPDAESDQIERARVGAFEG